jgi:hypothetical protein
VYVHSLDGTTHLSPHTTLHSTASAFNIVSLAKVTVSFWPYLALGMLGADILSRAGHRSGKSAH